MSVFNRFYHLGSTNAAGINSAFIMLLPKKDDASEINHFCLISLIHSIGKLISKVLSIRLSRVMQGVISPAQSAFQKQKCIQDNFLYVQNCI